MSAKPPKKASATRAAPRKAAAKPAATPRGQKRAQRVVERAKNAGAVGPFGTDAQRSMRDGAIVSLLAGGGRTQKAVAAEFGVSLRTVQAVVAAERAAPSLLDEVPMQIVEDFIRSMRRRIADFHVMAYRHADANPSVAVAALKGAQATQERLLELLIGLGKLPENLELFRAESELRRLADRMVETMGLLQSGDITAADAKEVFRQITESPPSRPRLQAVE